MTDRTAAHPTSAEAAHIALAEAAALFSALARTGLDAEIALAAGAMTSALRHGGTIYWCGNGGSASDAEHLAAELVGRFHLERAPLRSHALTVNSSLTTALLNDYGADAVFERPVRAFVREHDVLVAISTSGNSPNVLRAMDAARAQGAWTLALTGLGGGALAELAHLAIQVPSSNVPRIQEAHILIGHTLCELIERAMAAP